MRNAWISFVIMLSIMLSTFQGLVSPFAFCDTMVCMIFSPFDFGFVLFRQAGGEKVLSGQRQV